MHVILAAGEAPAFFSGVAVLLVASALVAYVCYRLRIMPIVSFLVTGALIGPHALGLVRDPALIEAAAEVGVVLLLFTIGIEFSLAKLARIKRLIFIGGGVQVGLVVALVAGLLALFGVGWRTGVFTGCLVALSSTAIVMKLLMDRGDANSEAGQAALGLLIFQDLAIVAMVLLVPALAGEGGSSWGIALALGKAIGIVALVIVVARRLMPRVLEAAARTCSQEIFMLTVVAICFGTAWLTSLAGVSLSLGAFLAGLMVSESRFRDLAFGEILPLQILFSATFFVSVGLLLDLGFLLANPLLVFGIVGGVLLLKVLTTGLSLRLLRYSAGTTAFAGLLLAQVGEFSFVLERSGREAGLFPAGLEDGGPQAFIAATVVLMVATPALARLGEIINARRAPHAAAMDAPDEPGTPRAVGTLRDHVIIAGYGEAGRTLAGVLDDRSIPYLIVTLSPDGAREAESGNLRVLRGDYTRQHELTLAGAQEAHMLVIADDNLETTRRVVGAARALSPTLRIVARTRFAHEIEELNEAGAADVVAEDAASVMQLVANVLEFYEVDPPEKSAMMTLTDKQRETRQCAHTDQARAVVPKSQGCEECLKLGDSWVHLRICMTCGQIGCCDSSKNKHARKHFHEMSHPIVKSFERGEDWAWCYKEQTFL